MALRLVFMGTPDFAVPTLAALIGSAHPPLCVYTRAPKPKGRGMTIEISPVHKVALGHDIPVRTPPSLRNSEEQAGFAAWNADAAIVVAYGLILPLAVLNTPRLGCFNLHASLLPRWRGAAPMQRAIMAGDDQTGIMVMRMEEGLDSGPVVLTETTEISRKTYGALHDELMQIGAKLVRHLIPMLEAGVIPESPQPDHGVIYARKVEASEARIDWSQPARMIDCLIRGLSPKPGAWFGHGGERIRILFAEPVAGAGVPGEFLTDGAIACGEGAIRPLSVQRAGRGVSDWQSFLRGYRLRAGDRLG